MLVKVSIIIPVYNAEEFLEECLDSIVYQTFNDIEIICINDGSTDNSLEILNEYASQDKRFKISSQSNQGQGVARNKGLDFIKGDYFCFLDADDKLELDTIEKCYNLAKKNSLDMVMFKLINFDNDTGEYYTTPGYDMFDVYNKVKDKIFNFNDLGESIFNVTVSPANKLFNSKFVLDSHIKFPKGTIFEDNVFFWRLFFNAKRIQFCNEYFYIRRRHSSSTTGFGGERWIDAIEIYNRVWDVFKEFGYFDKFKVRLYNNKIDFSLYRLENIDARFKDYYLNAVKEDLNIILKSHYDFVDLLNDKNKVIFNLFLGSKDYNHFLLLKNIMDLSNKVDDLNQKNNKIHNTIKDLVNITNDSLKKENYGKFSEDIILFNNHKSDLTKEYIRLKEENKYLRKTNFELYELKNEFLNSNSWKLTSYFRKIARLFK